MRERDGCWLGGLPLRGGFRPTYISTSLHTVFTAKKTFPTDLSTHLGCTCLTRAPAARARGCCNVVWSSTCADCTCNLGTTEDVPTKLCIGSQPCRQGGPQSASAPRCRGGKLQFCLSKLARLRLPLQLPSTWVALVLQYYSHRPCTADLSVALATCEATAVRVGGSPGRQTLSRICNMARQGHTLTRTLLVTSHKPSTTCRHPPNFCHTLTHIEN